MLSSLVPAIAWLTALSILCFTALRGLHLWLDMRRVDLEPASEPASRGREVGLRIELAALRERVKQLERIASGVEL